MKAWHTMRTGLRALVLAVLGLAGKDRLYIHRAAFILLSCMVVRPGMVGAAPCVLARDGKPTMSVVTAKAACPAIRTAATELAETFSKMFGSPVRVIVGDGSEGIAVGMNGDFTPQDDVPTKPGDLAAEQSYRLRTHSGGIKVIGGSEIAVEYAIWDLLHRLGYRRFFPHEVWEVIPELRKGMVSLDLDELEVPDYFDREIWYSWGGDAKRQLEWNLRNRMNQHGEVPNQRLELPARWRSTLIQNHHNYQSILGFNSGEFQKHPEYLALVDGKRTGDKFCISNPGLRDLAAAYALDYFKKHPDATSISMEPTDGYHWCECADCARMGTASTRMVALANHVAHALEADYPGKWIGVLGYADYWAAPAQTVHPRVVVSCATTMSGPEPVEERLKAWGKKATTLGIYDYYCVPKWNYMMPATMQGGWPGYLGRSIPAFWKLGARVMSAESTDCWGPAGLGYYLTSRLLWDVDEATNVDTIVQDFLGKAFGPAAKSMRAWYALMDPDQKLAMGAPAQMGPEYLEWLHPRMYKALLQAWQESGGDPKIQARLNHLFLYTRYVQLGAENARNTVLHVPDESADERVRRRILANERQVRFVWQIRDTGMVAWQPFCGTHPGYSEVDLGAPPSWLSEDGLLNLELANDQEAARIRRTWQDITPELIAEVHAEAARSAATLSH